MNAEEIRKKLVQDFGYTEVEANEIKGIAALRAELEENTGLTSVIQDSSVEEEDDGFISGNTDKVLTIGLTSPEWSDYVLSLFQQDELVECEGGEKRPNIHGLRRVSQKIFGEMLENHAEVIESPNAQNGWCATVKSTVIFYDDVSMRERKFSDVADVSTKNCEEKFARHASSTAATKAEARALRKLLQLKFISSEESTPSSLPEFNVSADKINDVQIQALDMLCKRYNVNVVELVNIGEQHYNNIRQVSETTAHRMLSILNEDSKRQELLNNNSNLVGYQESWKELFV